jgi:dCTP deaminase
MILVDYQIRELCEKGFVTPYDPNLVNPASLDIRVGDTAIIEDPSGGFYKIDLSSFSQDNPYNVEPGEWVMVSTLEVFNVPATVAASVRLKSSRARAGWDLAIGGWVDPGFNGSVLSMVVKNVLRYNTINLFPGLKFAQVILHSCDEPNLAYDKVGRYNGCVSVQQSKG